MGLFDSLFGRASGEKELLDISTEPFEGFRLQRFLPEELRREFTGPALEAGVRNITDLLKRPGGLSPAVAEAILPRLAAESESISRDFRGIRQQQAGAASRANVPISIQSALERALDVAQERAQRGTRREALVESEGLRREDAGQLFKILDALLQFISSGRGQAIPGLQQLAGIGGQRQASNLAFLGSLLSGARGTGGGGGGGAGIPIGGGRIGL